MGHTHGQKYMERFILIIVFIVEWGIIAWLFWLFVCFIVEAVALLQIIPTILFYLIFLISYFLSCPPRSKVKIDIYVIHAFLFRFFFAAWNIHG